MAGSWSIVVIMVSIFEKERDSYFRYSLRNSLKSVTRKEPGCRWNNNPRSRIYWIRSKLELFIGGNSDLRKCDCVRRLISVPRIFVRCAWAWHYFLNCSWLSEHRSQQATRGWVVIYIFIYYSYFNFHRKLTFLPTLHLVVYYSGSNLPLKKTVYFWCMSYVPGFGLFCRSFNESECHMKKKVKDLTV